MILKNKVNYNDVGYNMLARHDSSAHYVGEKGCYVAHLWGDDMPLIRERRVAIYCVLLAGLLIFWDGLCSDLWRSDNG